MNIETREKSVSHRKVEELNSKAELCDQIMIFTSEALYAEEAMCWKKSRKKARGYRLR